MISFSLLSKYAKNTHNFFRTIRSCLRLLSHRDRSKIYSLAILNVMLSILDLFGVILIGLTISLAVNGPNRIGDSGRIGNLLQMLNMHEMSFNLIIQILGLSAISLLALRSILSILIGRKSLVYLSKIGAKISHHLFEKILRKKIDFLESKTTQEITFSLTTGVETATSGVLGNFLSLIADTSTLTVLSLALLIYDPPLALSTLIMFFVTGIALHMSLHRRASKISSKSSFLIIRSQELIIESLRSFREMVTRGTAKNYSRKFFDVRSSLAASHAELLFMPQISKYVFDIALIIGVSLISVNQFLFNDSVRAISNIAVFFATASRISPSVLRVQQGLVQFKTQSSLAKYAIDLTELLKEDNSKEIDNLKSSEVESLKRPSITIRDLAFKHKNAKKVLFEGVNLSIPFGTVVAITGKSGAGKSTFADLIMGLLEPTSGEIRIGKLSPSSVIANVPGFLAYVPQEVYVANATIRDNLLLGDSQSKFSESEINEALSFSQLADLVLDLEKGLDSKTGENGSRFSGGQRQRLGIARAMLSKPRVIVFDEATSALDTTTEETIIEAINALRNKATVFIIAHRTESIGVADVQIEIVDGRILWHDKGKN